MRHGKPILDLDNIKTQWMSANRVGEIVREYEMSGLDLSFLPQADSIQIANGCALSMSSDLPRAIQSSELLGLGKSNNVDRCFRESALPYLELSQPQLTFFTWAILFRLAWLCGFSKNGESFKDAKSRAIVGADLIESSVEENGSVLHIGHGIMNRLIIKELRRRKWKAVSHTGEEYWSYTVLAL